MNLCNAGNIWAKSKKIISYNYEYFLLVLPALIYFLVIHYGPMYGVQIAFKNFSPTKGVWGSPWVGLEHFERFFYTYNFGSIMVNTVTLALYSMIAGFPVPILLALIINDTRNVKYKMIVQTATFMPHVISTVVISGIIISFLSPATGIVNKIIGILGIEPIYFMLRPEWFKHVYVWSGVWQDAGWNALIYIAALTAIDGSIYEAAKIDGASKLKCIWYINIPCILPTIITIFILNMGRVMNVGYEKVYLLQNPINLEQSEVISTYVWRMGLAGAQYSFSTAVGLFNSVINLILLFTFNKMAKKISSTSLW